MPTRGNEPNEAEAGLTGAVAVVTARLHVMEGRGSESEAAKIQTAIHAETGDGLVTGLATLSAGLVQFASLLNDLPAGQPRTADEVLQIVARRLAEGAL